MRMQAPRSKIFAKLTVASRRVVAAAAFVVLAGFAGRAAAEGIAPLGVQETPPYGFEAPCDIGEVLTGIFVINDGFTFLDVSPQCASASNPGLKIHPAPVRWYGADPQRNGDLWPSENPSCPDIAPVMLSIRVETATNVDSEIKSFRFQQIKTFCGMGPSHNEYEGGQTTTSGAQDWQAGTGTQFCPSGQVAVGIHGSIQSDYGLAEIGLICGDPKTGYNNKFVLSPGNQRIDTNAAASRAVVNRPVLDARPTPIRQPRDSRLDRISMPATSVPYSPPAAPPPAVQPPVAPPPDAHVHVFTPPIFDDGAQLWACANAMQGNAKKPACGGIKAGRDYCRLHGFSGALLTRANGTPDLTIVAAKPGIPVRASNGDHCAANDCAVIGDLHCAP